MPKSTHTHKSMLLRGIKPAPAALDRSDIEATKGRANHSGRSHGGAPLRGGYGNSRGRGGQVNYQSEARPNPFAAHINPGFAPPGVPNNYRGGPPPQPTQGWPPPPGADPFQRGPPPPYGGNSNGYPPTNQGHNHHGPQPSPHNGYYNVPPQPTHNGYHNGNYGNQGPNHNYYGPPQDGRYGGYNDRNGR